jgi:hypothetical protein
VLGFRSAMSTSTPTLCRHFPCIPQGEFDTADQSAHAQLDPCAAMWA